MKVVIDTNVFISGVFFHGPPYQILKAWHDGRIQLVTSENIFEEYLRVGEILSKKFPQVQLNTILRLLAIEAEFSPVFGLPECVCEDPDGDKFLASALSSKTKVIISGDKHLLKASGYHGIEVVSPGIFVKKYLEK
jgi:putative PIN family toxin of toxin-antitoxin system